MANKSNVSDQRLSICLPWPPAKSSPNGPQRDYQGKASAGRQYKADCIKHCWAQKVRRVDGFSAKVEVVFHPPTYSRYDLDNTLSRAKRGLDAVAEAIGIDDADWTEMRLVRGQKVKGGALVVNVTPAENRSAPNGWRQIGDIANSMIKGKVS